MPGIRGGLNDHMIRGQQVLLQPPFQIGVLHSHGMKHHSSFALHSPKHTVLLGKLVCVCLKPVAIHQDETIVQEIEFENGLQIKVSDAIALQDAAVIVVTGYQLIHPRDYNAYYRAKADFFKDNNFESLPKF